MAEENKQDMLINDSAEYKTVQYYDQKFENMIMVKKRKNVTGSNYCWLVKLKERFILIFIIFHIL